MARAEEELREVVALRPPGHPKRALTMAFLAQVLHTQQRDEEAIALYDDALRIYAEKDFQEHNEVAWVHMRCGLSLRARGCVEEARERWREARALNEKIFGVRHESVSILEDLLRSL